MRFKGADSLPQESRASRRADDSFEDWEKELRGNKNRSTARSAFPVATTEASSRRRPGVGRMAKLAPQRARKRESAQPQEPMDSIEVARGVAVKFELCTSLTTDIAVCPVGGTVPTTPIVGRDLLTDTPDTPCVFPWLPPAWTSSSHPGLGQVPCVRNRMQLPFGQ